MGRIKVGSGSLFFSFFPFEERGENYLQTRGKPYSSSVTAHSRKRESVWNQNAQIWSCDCDISIGEEGRRPTPTLTQCCCKGNSRADLSTHNRLQAKAARIIVDAYKATSGAALDVELHLLPVSNRSGRQVPRQSTESSPRIKCQP